ncbi:Uma2 family endonuclease [Kitasatospora sp. NPDC088134]|uniref:Uma2 family endonuclease n=1 Tax=Kitasatospora sp. NPDC088134 TaxID=3364071 RepID=UPI0037F4FBB6
MPAPPRHPDRYTAEDVLTRPPDPHHRVELLGGALLLLPRPDLRYRRAVEHLAAALRRAVVPPFEVLRDARVLVPDGLPVPDLVVADTTDAGLVLSADRVLVVAEADPPASRTITRLARSDRYAAAGIPHYWRLDLDPAPVLHLGGLERGGYVDRIVRPGESTALGEPFPFDFDPASLRR